MATNPPDAASSSDYEVIFDNALKAYKKKTGRDLASDPLLRRLETCNSPDSVLALLRQKIPAFDQSGSGDERLTNWVNPAVNVLYTFAATIGGAVSLGYPPAGVIFTGIASLLSTILAIGASQSALIDLFERIENFFIRLGTYIELPPTAEMTDIIVKVMVDVLLILALVTREIKQGKTKRFLKKLVGRSDIEDALRRLDKLTQEESRMAAAQGLKATHGVGEGVKVAIDKADAILDGGENMRGELQQVARDLGDLAKDASDDKRNQLREDLASWLSPPDPFINLNTADQARHEGTAVWFTQSSIFKSWKESSSLLWIHGKPGCGKSVLTSAIIQDINTVCNTASGHMAFFLFDFKDTGKQDARALLSSLIVQLSNQSDDFYNVLLRFYSAHHRGTQQPSIVALTQCLEDMLRVPEGLPIYLIIDALDECPNTTGMPSSRDQVVALVERLVKLNLPNLRLCVTSRPEIDIRTSLEPLTSMSNSISLHDESGQKKDIIDFVGSVVYSDKNMRRWREEDKQLVIKTLSDKADGMFRWVFCQLETLRHCFPPSVSRILAELPETLDATYERILLEIPKTNRVLARRLLQCLTVAVRPLTVEELAEVVAIDFDAAGGIPKLNEDFRWEDQEQAVLSACSSLVTIFKYRDLRRVQFSHFSVKEFLTSDRLATSAVDVLRDHHIRLEPAHTIMAQACLGVLLRLDDDMDKKTIKSYPLARYAGKCFVDHAKFEDVLSHLNDGVDYLLDPDKPHFNTWFWLQIGDYKDADMNLNMESSSELNDLDPHLGDLSPRLDDFSAYLDDSSSDSDDSSFGHSNSDDPVPKYPPRVSSLYYTLVLAHLCLAQRLIYKRPRDLDASDIYGKTALHIAVHLPDCEVVQMIIERAAEINGRDNKGCTPLHHAMEEDQDNIHCVRLLLDRGANVEAQNDHGSTPLHLAAFKMSQETVQLLIENSTNIDLRDNKGQTALHKASRRGHLDIMQLILNHDADVDAPDNDGSTPLHLAISEASLEAVQLLLGHGASVTLRNYKDQTTLHKASQRGYLDIIQLILNYDSDVDALDNDGSTPLHLAINDGSTPLHLELSESNPEALQLLLNHGANINLQNNMGQTALHRASQFSQRRHPHYTQFLHRRHLYAMQTLLNLGADVETLNNDGSTALHLAIFEANLEAVELLLRHGANVHRQNNRGETSFQAASARGLEEITRLLSMHIQSEQMT